MATAWMQQKWRWMRRAPPDPPPWLPDVPRHHATWLNRLPWDWWGTFTFAEWIHPEWAVQRYEKWATALHQETGTRMTHVRALEYQKRGVVHFHALIWGVNRRTSRKEWAEKWQEIGGGWAQLRNYDREKGAVYYLGKYVLKGGEVDLLRIGQGPGVPDDVRLTQPGPS